MTTKTFKLIGTFPEEDVITFAKYKGRSETKYNEEGISVPNDEKPEDYVSQYFLYLIGNELGSLQKMKVQEEIDKQKREMDSQIDEAIKTNLSITVE